MRATFTSLLALCCACVLVHAAAHAQPRAYTLEDVPNPRTTHAGFVTDAAQALGAAGGQLETRLAALQRDTGAEVAVVILPSIGDAVPKDFATRLFERWKIGRAGRDDGVLVLHVLDQRRVEIETGYGSEAALPDAKCNWLIQDVAVPELRAGAFGRAHAALVAGIAHAIRDPDAGHDALIAAARVGMPAAEKPRAARPAAARALRIPARGVLEEAGSATLFALGGLLLLAVAAGMLRLRAHRALHRTPQLRPDAPLAGWIFGLMLSGGLAVFAFFANVAVMFDVAAASFGVVAALVGWGALATFRQARARYAARSCQACQASMRLLREGKDEADLSPGQRTEQRIRVADYDVWKCACGAAQIERHEGSARAERCAACGFDTDQRKSRKVLKPATERAGGLAELHYQCAHCKVQRTERQDIPRIQREHSSHHSHGSGGSSSSSFGGGRSGGGGAGGSY
jgi:uncharacterized protein